MKKLYALLIGINNYDSVIPNLKGCANDVSNVLQFLKKLPDFDLQAETLVDEQATKQQIAQQFLQHLGQAGSEDVALFYFSGHGTRELAHPAFRDTATGGKLQALVCHDATTPTDQPTDHKLLANKELRYLIHQAGRNNPHFLTIFDCCHAGENTRGDEFRRRQFIPRLSTFAYPERPWTAFLFSDQLTAQDFQQKNINELLPEGRHISLSACLPTESAFEYQGHGAFTTQLLEVLERSSLQITYRDLQSRIRNTIKNQYRQTPTVYASQENPGEIFRFFLDLHAQEGAPLYANLSKRDNKWYMDMGHLQGISERMQEARVVSLDKTITCTARVVNIGASETELDFNAPDDSQLYRAFVEPYFPAPTSVFLHTTSGSDQGKALLEDQLAVAGKNILITDLEYGADYTVLIDQEKYTIVPAEDHQRPLLLPVSHYTSSSARQLMMYLKQISQWNFIKNLHNPNSWAFTQHPIQVDLFYADDATAKQALSIDGEIISPPFAAGGGGKLFIKLTNVYDRPLYVSMLYLSMTFQSYTGLLPQPVYLLEPGASVWAREGRGIGLSLEEHVVRHNWPASTSYLKLIINTDIFEVSQFEMAALPGPFDTIKRAGRDNKDLPNPDAADWTTRLLALRIENPNYQENAIAVG